MKEIKDDLTIISLFAFALLVFGSVVIGLGWLAEKLL